MEKLLLMSRLYSSHRIVKVLLGNGFVFVSQKGSHQKYKFGNKTVIMPISDQNAPYKSIYFSAYRFKIFLE